MMGAVYNNRRYKTGHILARFMLAVAIVLQAMVMSAAQPVTHQVDYDIYGSDICSKYQHYPRSNQDDLPICCVGGCILTAVAANYQPNGAFIVLSMRKSSALQLITVIDRWNSQYTVNQDARAPPKRNKLSLAI